MQSSIVVGDSAITGSLKYVEGYTGFDTNTENQKGNYLALKVEASAGSNVTVEVVGGDKGPVTLDSDMNIVLRIKNNAQSVKVIATKGEASVTKTYALTNLELLTQIQE